jgi:hypothetical protein
MSQVLATDLSHLNARTSEKENNFGIIDGSPQSIAGAHLQLVFLVERNDWLGAIENKKGREGRGSALVGLRLERIGNFFGPERERERERESVANYVTPADNRMRASDRCG